MPKREPAEPMARKARQRAEPSSPNKLLADSRQRLAERLAELRREKGWTLDRAAERTGVSRASLSKLEKAQMSPTFDVLVKLGLGYGLSPVALLGGSRSATAAGRRSITRAGEGPPHDTDNYAHRMLCTDLTHKAMLPFVTTVRARSLDDYEDWDRHQTEDFVYVLQGRMVLHTEHYEPERLSAGDSAYIDGRMGHAMVSEGKSDAVILWVSAP